MKQITKSLSIETSNNNECIFIHINGQTSALTLKESLHLKETLKVLIWEKINEY